MGLAGALGRVLVHGVVALVMPVASTASTAAPVVPVMRGVRHTFAIDLEADHFALDGRAFQIRCGEVHAPRVPREYWRHRLQLARAMGLNTVCAYLFWNLHEPREGEFSWT